MHWAELRDIVTAVLLFAAMMLSAWLGMRQRLGVVLLTLLSLVWFTVDRLWEGPVLVPLAPNRGLVTSDVVGLIGLVVAVVLGRRHRRRRRQLRPSESDLDVNV